MNPRAASYTLLLSVAALMAIGLVAIHSIGMASPRWADRFDRQMVWAGVGAGAFVIAMLTPYESWRRRAFWLLGLAFILLALTAVPKVSIEAGGARRWIGWGSIRFQPSELAKIAIILALAYYAELHHRRMRSFLHGFVFPGLIVVPFLALLFIQPDRGTTLLVAGLCGLVLLVAGVRKLYVGVISGVGTIAAVAYAFHDPLVLRRFEAWWNLEHYKDEQSYQAWQAMLAFGQGGLFGRGLGNGLQKRGFVPEVHTDFILCSIGEEMGLIGALTVMVLFVLVVWSGFSIARHARDRFGMLAAFGLTALIGFQAAINTAVVTSAVPCKGLALPFISYGGSALMMSLFATGLLYNIAQHSLAHEPAEPAAADAGGRAYSPSV